MLIERLVTVWIVAGAAISVSARGQATATQGAQSPAAVQTFPAIPGAPASASSDPVAGGRLHGVVKSGNVPLPGVTVTAQNTLTGKRYSTTTDITGAWSMSIPQNGRYVIRTQFAAFAQGSLEALLNQTGHDRVLNFDLMLASRAVAQQAASANGQDGENATQQAIRQLAGNSPENLEPGERVERGH